MEDVALAAAAAVDEVPTIVFYYRLDLRNDEETDDDVKSLRLTALLDG